MKIAIVLLIVAACALAQDNVFPADSLSENALAPEEDLLSAVKELRRVSDGTAYHTHGERIEDHAVLIQKAKAYKHSFGARNALRAAIRALVSELTTGHNHDRSALSRERNAGHNAIRNALNRGKSTAGRYREKACPTKKAQVEAEAARNSAKGRMNAIKRRKVCNLSTSWFDMNIKGSAPKFGGELRNKWDKARADYLRKLAAYNAAVRKYNKAAREHSGAMAAFRATVKAEAANAHSACRNAHKAYDLLAKDVASNVRTRKQVYIASKVITCYIDNLSNNGGAKGCADRARRANTSRWNITPSKMNACLNHVALQAQIGPLSWRPSKRNCHANHWNERGIKSKERTNKANERKRKNAIPKLTCATRSHVSNHAGVIRVGPHGGYTMTGGGMNNRYRHWNHLSAFEEMMPEGNNFRCDTGFGAGHLTCYNQACKVNRGALHCTTRSVGMRGVGVRVAHLPGGYTMTGGGIYNHYRSFNAHAGFEESFPHGNNGWRGDMGFGWGHFTVYVRGCRATVGRLHCVTRQTGVGNYHSAHCPGGYSVTGCGINNHYRHNNHLSAFEQSHPNANTCLCDSGFGPGRNVCYARCCKIVK